MKTSFIVLSLGASSLAAPLGLDSFYKAFFARDEVEARQDTPIYSFLPTGVIPSGTVIPTGTGTTCFPTGTSTGSAVPIPVLQQHQKPQYKPLSINYQLAPTIAADVLKKRQDDSLPELSLPTGTAFPTGTSFPTGVLPTGTGVAWPTGTGGVGHGLQPKPFTPADEEELKSFWAWVKGFFTGN